jgi:addiction module RelE/StbE family toxin
MKITFDIAASDDLDRIFAWIKKDNPQAAYETIERINARVETLATPGLCPDGTAGTRSRHARAAPYVIVYEVDEERNEIVVLSVVHGAQRRKR